MLLIGTPAYNCWLHIDYHNTVMKLSGKMHPPPVTMLIGNESLITRARNKIISFFHSEKRFSHLLFLDADIGMQAEDILRMLAYEKDVVAAGVALKGLNPDGSPVLNYKLLEQGLLVKAERVGTAVFLLSRKAVEVLIDQAPTYHEDVSRGMSTPWPQYDVFKVGVFDGEYLSEDYYACRTLRELGFDVYVDTSVQTVHNGNYPFFNR